METNHKHRKMQYPIDRTMRKWEALRPLLNRETRSPIRIEEVAKQANVSSQAMLEYFAVLRSNGVLEYDGAVRGVVWTRLKKFPLDNDLSDHTWREESRRRLKGMDMLLDKPREERAHLSEPTAEAHVGGLLYATVHECGNCGHRDTNLTRFRRHRPCSSPPDTVWVMAGPFGRMVANDVSSVEVLVSRLFAEQPLIDNIRIHHSDCSRVKDGACDCYPITWFAPSTRGGLTAGWMDEHAKWMDEHRPK